MLMALGFFIFDLKTAPYQELQRTTQWRHAEQNPIGRRPSYQYLGPGSDTIQLTGILFSTLTGGRVSLDLLRVIAEGGKGWPLIEGSGRLYGFWSVTEVQEICTELLRDGSPQKMEFSAALTRVDEKRLDLLGTATNSILTAATGVLANNRYKNSVL